MAVELSVLNCPKCGQISTVPVDHLFSLTTRKSHSEKVCPRCHHVTIGESDFRPGLGGEVGKCFSEV